MKVGCLAGRVRQPNPRSSREARTIGSRGGVRFRSLDSVGGWLYLPVDRRTPSHDSRHRPESPPHRFGLSRARRSGRFSRFQEPPTRSGTILRGRSTARPEGAGRSGTRFRRAAPGGSRTMSTVLGDEPIPEEFVTSLQQHRQVPTQASRAFRRNFRDKGLPRSGWAAHRGLEDLWRRTVRSRANAPRGRDHRNKKRPQTRRGTAAWWWESHLRDSNPGLQLYESCALPTELRWRASPNRAHGARWRPKLE